MKKQNTDMASKTAQLVEKHSYASILLALLCLTFAINYFLVGPGSDGGSGLGGTGKFGGESGLGGTGKGPDLGSGFKVGASDREEREYSEYSEYSSELESGSPLPDAYQNTSQGIHLVALPDLPGLIAESMVLPSSVRATEIASNSATEFDVKRLRLSLNDTSLYSPAGIPETNIDIGVMVENISLDLSADINQYLSNDMSELAQNTLVSSLDVLNQLMLVEAQTRISFDAVTTNDAEMISIAAVTDPTIRNRISVPVRPERPDRLNVPGRIAPIQRVNVPTPPPVRPMRTLSTLLNK